MNISACIITNEHEHLKECLESLRFVDEVILTITGNNKQVLNVAKEFSNVKIYYKTFWHRYYDKGFKKLFHYSNARNYCISKATKEWILIIDSDEKVENPVAIKELIEHTKEVNIYAWRFIQMNTTPQGDVPVSSTRFWRNNMGISYRKLVHETVDEYLQEQNISIGGTDIVLRHIGFNHNPVKDKERSKRIIEAIKQEKQPYQDYYLGIAYHQSGDVETATEYLNKALLVPMADNIKAHCHATLADIYRLTANFYIDMSKERIADSKKLIPEQNLCHFIQAEIYKMQGNKVMAKEQYKHLLKRDTTKSNMHQDLLKPKSEVELMLKSV